MEAAEKMQGRISASFLLFLVFVCSPGRCLEYAERIKG
jgi:hypothetical protein